MSKTYSISVEESKWCRDGDGNYRLGRSGIVRHHIQADSIMDAVEAARELLDSLPDAPGATIESGAHVATVTRLDASGLCVGKTVRVARKLLEKYGFGFDRIRETAEVQS
jgi:hypothetical protein